MKLSLAQNELTSYVCHQFNNFFPDTAVRVDNTLLASVDRALLSVQFMCRHVNNKYYFNGEYELFNHRNADQYCIFLYWLSRMAFKEYDRIDIAEKAYLLNKLLHGIDVFYEVKMPRIFAVVHPLGTVLGRASYSDFLLVYQRCGVGSNKGSQPKLGSHLTLHPGATVLGDSCVGNFCSVGADSLLIDNTLSSKTTYVGRPGRFRLLDQEDVTFWRRS